ncbi:MAG: 4Fe-4S dicluster domain-containing protein [Desulfobacteraceae bacterium]
MSSKLSRRSFLKAGLVTAGAVAAAGVPAQRALAGPDQELCTLLDISKCVACESCVEACRESNADKFPKPVEQMPTMYPQSRVKVADWSAPDKREIIDRLTPYNWLFIQTAEGEHEGEPFELNIPRRCMHCRNAPCANLCPFGAAYHQSNGIVRIEDDLCMGGAKCKSVCPWHIPERQSGVGLHMDLLPQYAGNGVMYKCDRCYQLVEKGETPACIEACPEEVQTIGPRRKIVEMAHALVKERGGYLYGLEENGGTQTIYFSPVPFEILNRAIEKGPGQPHMTAVEDSMAKANNWAKALAIAPVAGVVGALVRFVNFGKSGTSGEVSS